MPDSEIYEHYEVLRRPTGELWELGRGAMGVTYKALDKDLHCHVALKIIAPGLLDDEDALQRFMREARSAAQLRHQNIATVFRLGKDAEGTHFYTMEFCEGKTLQETVEQQGALSTELVLEIALQVTRALVVAEQHKVVHRDLKPANLILTEGMGEGIVVKIIDFGLAKRTSGGDGWASMAHDGFIGTAHFASPEQIEAGAVDTRSDIYSLGATMFFMFAGKPMFEGAPARIMSHHLTTPPPLEKLPALPPEVVQLIGSMLRKDPLERPATAVQLRQELLDCQAKLRSGSQIPVVQDPVVPVIPPPPPPPPPLPPPPPPMPVEVVSASPAPAPAPVPVPVPAQPASNRPVTVLDILRARGTLPLEEALGIASAIAPVIDESPACSFLLAKHQIRILFRSERAYGRELFQAPVVSWPQFDVDIERDEKSLADFYNQQDALATIVPNRPIGIDAVGALASLLHEMMGGVPGKRYVPISRITEATNLVLEEAISSGRKRIRTAAALIEELAKVGDVDPAVPGTAPTPDLQPLPVPIVPTQPIASAPPNPVSPISLPVVSTTTPPRVFLPPALQDAAGSATDRPAAPTGDANPWLASAQPQPVGNSLPPPPPMPRLSEVVADRFPPATPSTAAGGVDGRVKRKFPKLSRKKIILFSSIIIGVTAISIGIYAWIDRPRYRYSSYSDYSSPPSPRPAPPAPVTPTSNAFFKIGSQLTAGQVEEVITVSIQGQRMGTIVLKAAKKQDFLTIQIQQPGNFEVELTVYTYMADGKGVFGTSKALVNVKGGESFWVTALGASTDGVSTVYGLQKAE